MKRKGKTEDEWVLSVFFVIKGNWGISEIRLTEVGVRFKGDRYTILKFKRV